MKNLLLILFVGIIVSSCGKDDAFVLEGSYTLPSTMTVGKVRMYTSNGEVTDEAKIRKFLTGKSTSYSSDDSFDLAESFSFDKSTGSIGNESYLNITFKSDKATIYTNMLFGTDPDTSFDTELFKQGNLIIVSKGKSAVDVPVQNITEFFETKDVCKIRTNSHGITSPLGYHIPGRTNIALLEQNRQLVLPRLVYVHGCYLGHDNNSCNAAVTCNILNTDFVTHLPASDTIVVQEGWIIMQKQ